MIIGFSFLLEGILSNYLFSNTIPLFTLVVFVLLYSRLNYKTFLSVMVVTGLLYDICYINSFFFIPLLFLIVGISINKWFSIKPYNFLNVLIITIISIILYQGLQYFVLVLIGSLNFNLYYFIMMILKSLVVNIIYVIIVYLIYKYIINHFIVHKVK